MKRRISILLLICMMASFCALYGCSDTADTAEDAGTEEPKPSASAAAGPVDATDTDKLKNSRPNEYIAEKLEAGMEVLVAFIAIEFDSSTFVIQDEGFKKGFEEKGFTYSSCAYNMDTALHIQQVENYMTMNAAMIITCTLDNSLANTVEKCIEQGTYFCVRKSLIDYSVSLNVASDPFIFGQNVGEMVLAWVDYRYPDAGAGEVKLATVQNKMAQIFIVIDEGIQSAVLADGRVDIVYTSDLVQLSVDTGYTFAEEAMMVDPDTRIFIGYSFGNAMGISNYIMALQNADPDEFAVFSVDTDYIAKETVDASARGENVVRGFANEGGIFPHEYLLECALQMLFGEMEPGQVMPEPTVAYTGFGYSYDSGSES